MNGVAFHLVFCGLVISSLFIDKNVHRMQTTLTNLQDVLGFSSGLCTKLTMQTLVKDRLSLSEQDPNRLLGLLGTVKRKKDRKLIQLIGIIN